MAEAGTLYVVPTPVGNLEDMTVRAVNVLKAVDTILAEDTRTSGVLMKHFGITTKIRVIINSMSMKRQTKLCGGCRAVNASLWFRMPGRRPFRIPALCWSEPAVVPGSRWNVCRVRQLLCRRLSIPACHVRNSVLRVFFHKKKGAALAWES